ncbi:hypothetical protein ACFXPJ_09370 [Streptomyces goshikiensis]
MIAVQFLQRPAELLGQGRQVGVPRRLGPRRRTVGVTAIWTRTSCCCGRTGTRWSNCCPDVAPQTPVIFLELLDKDPLAQGSTLRELAEAPTRTG